MWLQLTTIFPCLVLILGIFLALKLLAILFMIIALFKRNETRLHILGVFYLDSRSQVLYEDTTLLVLTGIRLFMDIFFGILEIIFLWQGILGLRRKDPRLIRRLAIYMFFVILPLAFELLLEYVFDQRVFTVAEAEHVNLPLAAQVSVIRFLATGIEMAFRLVLGVVFLKISGYLQFRRRPFPEVELSSNQARANSLGVSTEYLLT